MKNSGILFNLLFKAFFLMIITFIPFTSYSQWLDGGNFDFSNGDYSGWIGYKMKNDSPNAPGNTIIMTNSQVANDPTTLNVNGTPCFVLYNNPLTTDPLITGGQLRVIPPGYSHSTRINCDPTTGYPNGNANMLTYDLLIDQDNCLLTFNYAMVLESPGHQGFCNPFF